MYQKSVVMAIVVGLCAVVCQAQPSVSEGFEVEAYLTGLDNPNALAFSPGGAFGYEGDLFVGDSRPDSGNIHRATGQGQMGLFAKAYDCEPRSFAFAPAGSSMAPGLYIVNGFHLSRCNGPSDVDDLGYVGSFRTDMAFAPDGTGWDDTLYVSVRPSEVVNHKADGSVSSVARLSSDLEGLAFGPGGAWGNEIYCFTADFEGGDSGVHTIAPDGTVDAFTDSDLWIHPNQGAFSPDGVFGGNLYVSDWGTDTIYSITPAGDVSVFADGFSFSQTPFHELDGGDIVFGPDGAMYVADGGAGAVYRIVPEPATMGLLTVGGLALLRRRRLA